MFNIDTQREQSTEKYDYLLKIIYIGNMGVGKSSVISRFSHGLFSSEYTSTIGKVGTVECIVKYLSIFLLSFSGIDFKIKTVLINGKRVKLQLW